MRPEHAALAAFLFDRRHIAEIEIDPESLHPDYRVLARQSIAALELGDRYRGFWPDERLVAECTVLWGQTNV